MGGDQSIWRRVLAALSCFLGGVGVVLAAIAAHRVSDPALVTASHFLLFHSCAALSLVALTSSLLSQRTVLLVAASVMLVGVCLFSGDIALRVLWGRGLFPLAAPIGGSAVIVSWLLASIGFVLRLRTAS